MTLPRDPAVVIAACLDPVYSSLENVLRQAARSGTPPQSVGREDDAPAFSTIWPRTPQRQRAAAGQIGSDRLRVLATAAYRKRLKDGNV